MSSNLPVFSAEYRVVSDVDDVTSADRRGGNLTCFECVWSEHGQKCIDMEDEDLPYMPYRQCDEGEYYCLVRHYRAFM